MPEAVIYEDNLVRVTGRTIVIRGTTTFLNNVNSVTVMRIPNPSPGALMAFLFGLVLLIGHGFITVCGVLFIAAAIAACCVNRNKGNLLFDTSSGRQRGLVNMEVKYLCEIRDRITQAISQVGVVPLPHATPLPMEEARPIPSLLEAPASSTSSPVGRLASPSDQAVPRPRAFGPPQAIPNSPLNPLGEP